MEAKIKQIKSSEVIPAITLYNHVFRVNLEKMAVCDLCEKSINCIRRDLDKPEYIYFIVEEANND